MKLLAIVASAILHFACADLAPAPCTGSAVEMQGPGGYGSTYDPSDRHSFLSNFAFEPEGCPVMPDRFNGQVSATVHYRSISRDFMHVHLTVNNLDIVPVKGQVAWFADWTHNPLLLFTVHAKAHQKITQCVKVNKGFAKWLSTLQVLPTRKDPGSG